MAIININQDSFFSGSRVNEKALLQRAESHLAQGADMLDLGAQSSRPGAQIMDVNLEAKLLTDAVKKIKNAFPSAIISIDSYQKKVQQACLDVGSNIINNIGANDSDASIAPLSQQFMAPYIAMHIRGNSGNMQQKTSYKKVLHEVIFELSEKVNFLRNSGVKDIIIDPGFGFAKTVNQNYTLLKNLSFFKSLNCTILAGLSRKSMLYKPMEITPEEALPATCAANLLALQGGAKILRVHDVNEAQQVVKFWEMTQ